MKMTARGTKVSRIDRTQLISRFFFPLSFPVALKNLDSERQRNPQPVQAPNHYADREIW